MPFDVDYHAILPETIVAVTIIVVVVMDSFLRQDRKWWTMPVSFLGIGGALIAALTLIGDTRSSFDGTYVSDGFAVVFKVFFLAVALVVLALSLRYFREGGYFQGEYYFLLLTSFLGMLTISSSRDLLMLFISLELVSAPGFLMAGLRKGDPRSNEGALKFFLIGILSTAITLYGMSLVYGITGSLRLDRIAEALGTIGPTPIALASVLFVVAGFGFKVSSVPFHFWAPDTYEGSPVPVAAFLSVASKAAGFVALIQLMFVGFAPLAASWAPFFAVLSLLTMTVGNLVALQQRQVVRLLAYSSIAQAGYMLLPFALAGVSPSVNQAAVSAAVLYILIYAVMNLGAFAVVVAMAREAPGILISDFAALGQRAPHLAVPMMLFLLSLAGLPPLAGFWAKFFIFQAAINAFQAGATIAVWLAAVMVINSVVSLYYYIAIAKQMFFVSLPEARPVRVPALVSAVALASAVAVVAVGIFPDLFAQIAPGASVP